MRECVYMGDIVTSLTVCSDNRWVRASFVIYNECVSIILWTCQLNLIRGPQKRHILCVIVCYIVRHFPECKRQCQVTL